MCEVCEDLLELLEAHDVRIGDRGGMQLTKTEILAIVSYSQHWPQRQCMCCYKDIKNFERFNNLLQLVIHRAIGFIESLPRDHHHALCLPMQSDGTITGDRSILEARCEDDIEDVDVTGIDPVMEASSAGVSVPDDSLVATLPLPVAALLDDTPVSILTKPSSGATMNVSSDGVFDRESEQWSLDEKDRLFQFVAKLFLNNFPLYIAAKHCVHTSLEDLSKHDASALTNYCELTDLDASVFLLRNVCYFCDINGVQALASCFRDSDPETLLCHVAHSLLTICANVRMWMNITTASRYVAQIRHHIVEYICRFAEKDLRLAATRNMTDLVWQTLKEPRLGIIPASNSGEVCILDRDGLQLALKYFKCSMLTLRLAGIAQINSQISLYNELSHSDSASDIETTGYHLADWLIENGIVEQIFGPNLHIEIVKQSQIILNFLASECYITIEHIDVIWASAQLKHCGKQVYDLLLSLVKSLDISPAKHLLDLMSQLEPAAHTEQTLMLASAIIRLLWSTAQNRSAMPPALFHGDRLSAHQAALPHYYAMIGHHDDRPDDGDIGELIGNHGKVGSFSSSGQSDSSGGGPVGEQSGRASSGNETEEGEVKARHLILSGHGSNQSARVPKVWVKLAPQQRQPGHEHSCSTEEQHSSEESDEEEEEEEDNEESESEGESNSSAFSGEEVSPVQVMRPLPSKGHAVRRSADNLKMRIVSSGHKQQFVARPVKQTGRPIAVGIPVVDACRQSGRHTGQHSGNGRNVARRGFPSKTMRFAADVSRHIHHEESSDDGGISEPDEEREDEAMMHMQVMNAQKGCEVVETDEEVVETDESEEEDGDDDDDEEDSSEYLSSPTSAHGCGHQVCMAGSASQQKRTNRVAGTRARTPKSPAGSRHRNLEVDPEDEQLSPRSKRPKAELSGVEGPNSSKPNVKMTSQSDAKDTKAEIKPNILSEKLAVSQSDSDQPNLQAEYCNPEEMLNQCSDDLAILKELECQTNSSDENRDPTDDNEGEQIVVSQEMLFDGGVGEEQVKMTSPNDLDLCLELETGQQRASIAGDMIEDILSPEEDDGLIGAVDAVGQARPSSCNSSHFSDNNKSEKNMSDFDGEGVLSEEELTIAACRLAPSGHLCIGSAGSVGDIGSLPAAAAARQLSSIATVYPMQGGGGQRPVISAQALQAQLRASEAMKLSMCGVKLDEVCLPGNTLLWDLVQDHNIEKLPEGLATEAEKNLQSLVCYATNRQMRTKFIEACIQNLENHRSVVISLRLMSKILTSFNQYRPNADMHQSHTVTMWAERELHLTKHFFSDLSYYTNSIRNGGNLHPLYSYRDEIQTRLYFLLCIFSNTVSPESFKLTMDQVDALWNCLAMDPQCSDDCLNWFLNVVKSKDHHALDIQTLRHIFLYKMPQLKPEDTSMIGLSLFNQLCQLARIANASMEQPLSDEQVSGIDQLWGIALRAQNTDVSLTAIQCLNNYYIGYGSGALEKEEEFVQKCMESLSAASSQMDDKPESSLLIVQRGLILLTNHLESFRKRYAFHLRQWQLQSQSLSSHHKTQQEKHAATWHVILQPAGSSEKTTLEMFSTDLIAELRAEVTHWWETVVRPTQQRRIDQETSVNQSRTDVPTQARSDIMQANPSSSVITPILGAMLVDGPLRLITLGQELFADLDEKSLGEVGFKDGQLVFVSQSANRPLRKPDGGLPASLLPAPPQCRLPMTLLSRDPHFGCLFSLLQQLSSFCPRITGAMDTQEQYSLQMKSRLLSRKVWDLLTLLPTNPEIHERLSSLVMQDEVNESANRIRWEQLLNADNPHKLVYSLQIIESLSRPPKYVRRFVTVKSLSISGGSTPQVIESKIGSITKDGGQQAVPEELWNQKFIKCGGLRHLYFVFLSGRLQVRDGDKWNEWLQDSLAYLLKLMMQFSVMPADMDVGLQMDCGDNQDSPIKKARKHRAAHEKLVIPRLNQAVLSANLSHEEIDKAVSMLMSILHDAAIPRRDYTQWPAISLSHVEVVHYTVLFLVSLALSCKEIVHPALCNNEGLGRWLKRLTLESPEPPIRQEACQGLYRLCLGRTVEGQTGYSYLLPILANLLTSLDEASVTKTPKRSPHEDKEPFGPGCRDYFWLTCHLVEGISKEDAEASWEQDSLLDLNELVIHLSALIHEHGCLERRHNTVEDDALIGLLMLASAVVRHNPPFKSSANGQAFLNEVFECLFALPSPKQPLLPKCKSQASRAAAYDLLVDFAKGNVDNYTILHQKVMMQHHKDSHQPYSWDTWPHDEERAKCGFVGLTNLGATCYMATCMQHLYMIPEARKSIIEAKCTADNRHEGTLIELKKMFTYLLESERKAYNPRSFCQVYTMDHQPLNTGEQKDMTEFFTDLISKLEEMGPELKRLVKHLFGGIITNNVVSLDCPHVSRTKEEFYTVRCQVTDMKNLYESLDEVTVKDMLEGDNMYTCSKCQRKVRAEKRACFRKLPMILCFNTMRYTFNMVTMMKEKVNTHFSFPLQLDMSPYMEKNLIRKERLQADDGSQSDDEKDTDESYEYDLIGVTVHTGTADGGHYYSFIRDRLNKNEMGQDSWYLFNDAEVKPFDPAQIATECFGGEMTSKTYDTATDKFMDFSFEKTNSAYMLFYERLKVGEKSVADIQQDATSATETNSDSQLSVMKRDGDDDDRHTLKIDLSPELADWIWQDNRHFLQDKNIFEHNYFGFMWQMCSYIPPTLSSSNPEKQVSVMAAKLSASFILETLIHAKEKPTMLQWIEIATKLFNSDSRCCEWFLDTIGEDDWWPQQILIRCPNQTVRQMFQRLVIHVINQLKPLHSKWYCHPVIDSDDEEVEVDPIEIGNKSCVTRFIKKMFAIMEQDSRPQCKYLTEYFNLLLEFARSGDNECQFLLRINAISQMIIFFMSHKQLENYIEVSDEEEKDIDDIVNLTDDKYSTQSLDKMITLIALLVEKSRVDKQLCLSTRDLQALTGGGSKTFPFLYHQIRDSINLRQTCNLIFSLCRWNDRLASSIVQMVFQSIMKNPNDSQPFFKLLSLIVEFTGGPPGLPSFINCVLQKFWDLAAHCPQQCIEWLTQQVMRNKFAQTWTLNTMEAWVEQYLMNFNNIRVRNAAAHLLISLVPNNNFRQAFRQARNLLSPHKDHLALNEDSIEILHKIYNHLLKLLAHARKYVDLQIHGTSKLVAYFAILNYCLISRTEKLMFQKYFMDLWLLFQPKLSEPPIPVHHNKQAMLIFWHQLCVDCPENIRLIVTNPQVTKNIAFNYILADHEEQDVIMVNRTMLPAYYGILRMCCQQSQAFTRQLAQHQNMQWAFKNITTHPTQYTAAVEELFKIMQLMVTTTPETTEEEMRQINSFRRNTIQLYLQILDPRNHWQTLVQALKILVLTNDDRLLVIQHQGLPMLHEAFNVLHLMHHEATACHVTDDIVILLTIMHQILSTARKSTVDKKADIKQYVANWKDRSEFARKLLTLLNSYTPVEIRKATFDTLREMILTFQNECIQTIVPMLKQAHATFQDAACKESYVMGPYFPKVGQKVPIHKTNIRSPRPQFQMFLHGSLTEVARGVDSAYDQALSDYFDPYHQLIDLLVRVAVNQQCLSESVVNLSATVACEGVPLHMVYFAKLWYDIYMSETVDRRYIEILCASIPFLEYVSTVLLEERTSLNNLHIHQFFCNFFSRVHQQVLGEHGPTILDDIVQSIANHRRQLENAIPNNNMEKIWSQINGDLRAMSLIFSVQPQKQLSNGLFDCLRYIMVVSQQLQQSRRQQQQAAAALLQQQQQQQLKQQQQQLKQKQSSATAGELPAQAAHCRQKSEIDTEPCDNASVAGPSSGTSETLEPGTAENIRPSASDELSSSGTGDNVSLDVSVADGKGKTPLKRRHKSSADDAEDAAASPAKRTTLSSASSDTGQQREAMEGASSHFSQASSDSSEEDETDESENATDARISQSAGTASNAASVLLLPKERPTSVDLVVKSIENIFRLLKK